MKTLIAGLVLGLLAGPAMAACDSCHADTPNVDTSATHDKVLNTVDRDAICSASTELADAIEETKVDCPAVQ